MKNLEHLYLDHNNIQSISHSISDLPKLKILSLVNNRPLTSLVSELFAIPNLQELNLKKCPVTSLPSNIGDCKHLRVLELQQTQITELPESIGECEHL